MLYSAGFALIVLGIARQSAPLLLAGACVRSAGSRWVVVLMGIALCKLDKRACMLCIASLLSPATCCAFRIWVRT